jgi:DNA (cytosine-5)-methyltransferase 1
MTTTDQNVVYNKQHPLRTFHLFCGAGGGVLADLLLGHNPIGACEIEPYPRNVLLARQRDGHLPEFPIWDDVCTLDGKPWRGAVDVLCGGFPCQDISAAGKGAGISGKRSGLWKEYKRLIGEMRPDLVFAENSPILRKRGLDVVLRDLAELGYNARWCVLGSCDLHAPHSRKRIWILGSDATKGRPTGDNKCSNPKSNYASSLGAIAKRKWRETESRVCGRDHVVANRLDRIGSIGNGQDAGVAALAFSILSEGLI